MSALVFRATVRRSPVFTSTPQLWLSVILVLFIAALLRLVEISRYPPGFHYDEAVNFIVAREIAFYGARPFPVFAAFNGREVLHFYLEALAMRLIGQQIFALRIVNFMENWLTVAATIGLGTALFGKPRGLILGLLAAGMMAVSFPQIFIARQVFRAGSLPMLQALCLWTLFVGLRRPLHWRKWWRWSVLAGILGGLALYTYMASRLFPGWVALIVVAVWLFDGRNRRRRFVQGAVVMAALLVVALPIINYYRGNPDVFADRLSQLSAAEETPSYAESVRLHLKMFFIQGDPYLRYNEPFVPYFDPLTGALLVVGLGASLWRLLWAADPVTRAGYLIVACAPLMVIPSVLAVGGMPPSHMRSIGMIPLIFFLPAIGAEALWTAGRGWLMQNKVAAGQAFPMYVAWGTLIVMAVWVWGRYSRWAANPELFYLSDGDMVAAGEWLEAHSDSNTLMYVTALHYDHPSLRMHNLRPENLTFLLGGRLFLPPPDREAYLIETRNAPLSPELRAATSGYERHDGSNGPDGKPAFTVYHWLPVAPSPDTRLIEGVTDTIGGWLALLEADASQVSAGQSVMVTSKWLILNTPAYDDLTPIFQLETAYGDVLARTDPYTRYSSLWRPGEILIQQAQLEVPIGTPPGEYSIKVVWVARAANQYVGRVNAQGQFAGIQTDLLDVTIRRPDHFPTEAALSISQHRPQDVLPGVRLLGWSDLPASIRPGERLKLDLYWQARPAAEKRPDEVLRFLALPVAGAPVLLWQGAPVMDSYPFDRWMDGELVVDRQRWTLPTDLAGGDYRLVLETGNQQIAIGDLVVLAVNRQFTAPNAAYPVDVNLGDLVRLVGYDLTQTTFAPGDDLHLTLYWQSLKHTDLPLTVFVHLVGPNNVIYAQRDWQPRQNTYPVALWLAGEYVDDPYILTIPSNAPAGTYRIRVGLYLQASGQTLARTQDGTLLGDDWALAQVIIEGEQ